MIYHIMFLPGVGGEKAAEKTWAVRWILFSPSYMRATLQRGTEGALWTKNYDFQGEGKRFSIDIICQRSDRWRKKMAAILYFSAAKD